MKNILLMKEIIICVIIIIIILVADSISQNYTKDSIGELTNQLTELQQHIESKDNIELLSRTNKLNESWDNYYEKLAYFIEHNELEKVETHLVSMQSFLKTDNFEEALNEINKNIFVLEHIQNKYAFSIQNVF